MQKDVHSRQAFRPWAVFLAVMAFLVAAGGYAYYRYESDRIRQEKYAELAAIGELKAGQIQQWRHERIERCLEIHKGPVFQQGVG